MARVRFDGPGRLRVFGYELRSGQVADMTDEQAAELAAHPHIKVTVLGVVTRYAADVTGSAAATTRRTLTKED